MRRWISVLLIAGLLLATAAAVLAAAGGSSSSNSAAKTQYCNGNCGGGGGPSAKHCVDRRRFVFTLHQPRGGRIVRVAVYVNGRRVRTIHRRRIVRIALARLPLGTFTVRLVATTNRGVRIHSSRRYSGCRQGRTHTTVRRHKRH